MPNNKGDYLKIKNSDAQRALLNWHNALSERDVTYNGIFINGRGWRARLKRMDPPYGVMMSEGYHILREHLSKCMKLEEIDEMALALFVSVAIHIKGKHDETLSFAAQLGEHKGNKPCFSVLRFEKLQKADNPDTFCKQLINAVKIRETVGGINILSLADSIFLWMEQHQQNKKYQLTIDDPFRRNDVRWASEYISKAYVK